MKAIVLVEWDDASMDTESHWQVGGPPVPEANLIFSVGFVVHRTQKYLVLVQSVADGSYAHKIQIPRAMIRSITTLEKKRPIPAPAKPTED